MLKRINWDAIGITTSLACAIHCAVLPLILSSLPIFGVNIIENEAFEFFMIGLAFVVGIVALSHGYRKHHHNLVPMLLFSTGMMLLVAKQVFHSLHIWLLLPSVILIVSAHYFNFKLCQKAGHCHPADCKH